MQGVSSAFKVGLLVTAAIVGWLFWFFNTSKNQLGGADTIGLHAYFKSAGGLSAKSKVTVAGLDVGQIAKISLVNLDAVAEEVQRCEQLEAMKRQGRSVEPPPGQPRTTPPCRRGFWARVDVRVKRAFPLYQDAAVAKATAGLLGSNLLELTSGDPGKARLDDGAEIVNVAWQSGMEQLFASVGNLEGDLRSIVQNVNGITGSINDFFKPGADPGQPPPNFPDLVKLVQGRLLALTDDLGRTMAQVNGMLGDNRGNIKETIANLSRVSEELKAIADGTGERGIAFNSMVNNVQGVTEQLRAIVGDLRDLIGNSEAEVVAAASQPGATPEQIAAAREGVRGVRATVEKLNTSLDALARVTNRIANGEGTVGRLLTDDKIANDIEDAIEGAGNIVAGINRMDTHVEVSGWYNFNTQTVHDGLTLRLQPRPDKYYLVELVSDSRRTPDYSWRTTTTDDPQHTVAGDQTPTTVTEFVSQTTDKFAISAMFAKMWGPLTLRVGILENSGAVGANLQFWDDRIRLRSDLFQFSIVDRWPRWRTMLTVEPVDHLFLVGGVDDVFNAVNRPEAGNGNFQYDEKGWDYFAGAGIGFTDDDLKALLTVLPSP